MLSQQLQRGQQRRELLLSEGAELAARERAPELQRTELGAQHRLTSAPWRSKSWRTCLPLAPRSVTVYQRLAPSPPAASQPATSRCAPLSSVPLAIPCSCTAVSAPRTRTPKRLASACTARCRRAASSPSALTSSMPPSTRGIGLTAMKRRPLRRGSRSSIAGRAATPAPAAAVAGIASDSPGER